MEETLRLLGCIVKGKFDDVSEDYSACGILLYPHQDFILSHGCLLAELCLKNKSFYTRVVNGDFMTERDLPRSNFTALVDSRWMSHVSGVHPAPTAWEAVNDMPDCPEKYSTSSNLFTPVKCRFVSAFRNTDFHEAVSRIMPDSNWTFTTSASEDTATENSSSSKLETVDVDETSVCFNLLSYFVLLRVQPLYLLSNQYSQLSSQNLPVIPKFPPLRKSICNIGDGAEIIATPFGSQNPSVFFNTYSRGVVCNVSGTRGCWILSDARCIPGCEGGPVFTVTGNQSRYLTGIAAASLCWKNKEWVGFSLVCSLNSIFDAFRWQLKRNRIKLRYDSEKEWTQIKHLIGLGSRLDVEKAARERQKNPVLSSTVLVRVGSTWGSGIIIDKEQGVLLTCSHVVKDSKDFPVMIKPSQGSREYKALVIYRHNSSLSRPYDIAVLKCPEATSDLSQCRVPGLCIPKLGEKVWAVGHALFSSDLDLKPSACLGVVSKVIKFKGHPVMVQSTCAVHAGASGGPLLSDKGDLVGILVCNTIDKGSNSCYPHINMSIPAESIWPALQNYMSMGDLSGFSSFELSDPTIRKLWALDTSVCDGAVLKGKL